MITCFESGHIPHLSQWQTKPNELSLFQTKTPCSKTCALLGTMGKSQTQGGAAEQLVEQCHIVSTAEMLGTRFYNGLQVVPHTCCGIEMFNLRRVIWRRALKDFSATEICSLISDTRCRQQTIKFFVCNINII